MSEKILSYFTPGLLQDGNQYINYIIRDQEYRLPILKICDFLNDYLSLEHDLNIKEVSSKYSPIIIDFCPFIEIENNLIGEICGKIVDEIKNIVDCTTFDFKCYVFKKIEDPKSLRLIFPGFFMKRKIICNLLYKALCERYLSGTSINKIQNLHIPFHIDFFDERNGYKFHGAVDKMKFKIVKELNFSLVNKGIENGMFYNAYRLLSGKYPKEKLIPIIFSINIKKPVANSEYSVENNVRYGAEICKKNIMDRFGGVCEEVIPPICRYLSVSNDENTVVPNDQIKKLVSAAGDASNKDPIVNHLTHNHPSIYFININQIFPDYHSKNEGKK